ncbi:MAG TPA: F0F1 ATP synthase subunit B [Candidatus Dormibacteraeota bacterium]|nr:F0F1 ATP synthase subunit B [Candidatus Dormibacteraeota bacterium]
MFVVPNLTLLVQVLAFIVLMLLLARYLYRPIQQVLEARTKRIEEGLKAADEAKREREAAGRDYEKRLDEARREGQALIEHVTARSDQLRKELEAKAREQADAMIEKARSEIQQERKRAVEDLRRQVGDLAVLAAGRVIGENLDAQKHKQLIDRAIEEAELRA